MILYFFYNLISKPYSRLQKTGKELSSILVWASTENSSSINQIFSIKLNNRRGWIPVEVVPDHPQPAIVEQHHEVLKVRGREAAFIDELISCSIM